jgi:SNF2 family DNA or RNA helicase
MVCYIYRLILCDANRCSVFRDAAAVSGLASQPNFSNRTRRPDALKDLLASVPEESAGVARSDKAYLDKAIKHFSGHNSIGPAPDGNWQLKGLKSTLKHYQTMGVAFMREREQGTHEPKGGLLADEMGLGKTVMMLANIVRF